LIRHRNHCCRPGGRHLGEALGQLYVRRYFNEAAKRRVLDLVNNLQKSFENRINHLDWMSDSTKQKAKEKRIW